MKKYQGLALIWLSKRQRSVEAEENDCPAMRVQARAGCLDTGEDSGAAHTIARRLWRIAGRGESAAVTAYIVRDSRRAARVQIAGVQKARWRVACAGYCRYGSGPARAFSMRSIEYDVTNRRSPSRDGRRAPVWFRDGGSMRTRTGSSQLAP